MSNQYAAETCPNCNGTKKEPLSIFDRECDFCRGHDGKPCGVVSHFKMALWYSMGNKPKEEKTS